MKPTLTKGSKNPAVKEVRAILVSQGYKWPENQPDSLFYDEALAEQVAVFQAQHVGEDGHQLKADGITGPKTWWSLANPAGPAQKGKLPKEAAGTMVKASSGPRAAVLHAAYDALKAPTLEVPNGANWGGNVSKILANHGQPDPWCLLFISYCFKQATGKYPFGQDQAWVYGFWAEAKRRGCAHPIGDGYVPRPGDVGVIIYPGAKKQGHVFFCVAVEAGQAIGYRFNHIGGNEGNAVRFGLRKTWAENFVGFVNLFGDDRQPYTPQGLVSDLGEVLGEHAAGTR